MKAVKAVKVNNLKIMAFSFSEYPFHFFCKVACFLIPVRRYQRLQYQVRTAVCSIMVVKSFALSFCISFYLVWADFGSSEHHLQLVYFSSSTFLNL